MNEQTSTLLAAIIEALDAHIDARIKTVLADHQVDLDDAIQSWMNNNLEDELTSAMQDFIRNSVTVSIDTI
jgi:hypothetical protein